MVQHFHAQRVRWLWWLALLCAAAGGGALYYLQNSRPDPNTQVLISMIMLGTVLTVGICVICATAHLWMRR